MAAAIRRHPRKLIAAGVVATAAVFSEYLPNPLRTTGVDNIEKRYSSGGGSTTHTPATATRRGHPDETVGNLEKSTGMGTPHWEEHIGGQKPEVGAENGGSKFDKAWNQSNYGNSKGK